MSPGFVDSLLYLFFLGGRNGVGLSGDGMQGDLHEQRRSHLHAGYLVYGHTLRAASRFELNAIGVHTDIEPEIAGLIHWVGHRIHKRVLSKYDTYKYMDIARFSGACRENRIENWLRSCRSLGQSESTWLELHTMTDVEQDV